MNPFAQVRKVPLFYGGVQSNAYSVQTYDLNKTVEVTVDKSFIQEGSIAGEWLRNRGYEIEN